MAQDILKPVGAPKSSKPDAGGGNIRSVPVLGVVKNNVDPIRSGRLQVYIADFGSNDPDDASAWVTVSFMSPFFGAVQSNGGDNDAGTFVSNPSSYGMWNSPPDIGSTVVCLFINGDPSYGYYIGCVPKPESLHMVPAIGSSENIIANNGGEAAGYGGATRLPVTNINVNNAAIADNPNFLKEPKPVHSYSAMIMSQQGLIRDPLRGPISSSAQRESPSRVGWGVSTPGRPIYEGGFTDENVADAIKSDGSPAALRVIARRGGHSIVMDDGDVIGQDQLVRIRSAKGHQILMSDDGQTLFIVHSNGQSYIELGKEGTIDMYSTNSVNVRTHGDLNFHADNNINLNAAKKLNLHAENIVIQSDQDTAHKVGANYKVETAGTYTHKVAGPMSMQSAGDASFSSSGLAFINGSKINLNTGSSSTVPAAVPAIPLQAHTDTLYDSVKGYAAAPGKLLSITSRAPAHTPWANAGQGVDVKTSISAGAALPATPSTKVEATNASVSTSPVSQPVAPASVATVPSTKNVSAAIDKGTGGAMVATVAQAAANNPAATAAINKGAGVITTATGGLVGSVGILAQSPKLLETAGLLKPGTSRLIGSLIQSGKNIADAIPSNLFTGQMGAKNLSSVASNIGTQVQVQVANFQRAQGALTQLGLISGRESSGSIAGLVLSGANVGIKQTMDVVKGIAAVGQIQAGVSAVTNEATNAINSGNYAAALSQSTLGGLASVVTAVGALDKLGMGGVSIRNAGPTGAAFLTILSQFKSLKIGVPQNLRVLAQEAAEARATAGTTNAITGVISAIGTAAGLPTGSVNSITGIATSVNTLTKTKDLGTAITAGTSLVKNISRVVSTMSASSYASGINNLPGGQTIISAVDNQLSTAKLPGTSTISNMISNALSSTTNGISMAQSANAALGAAGGALTSVSNAASAAAADGLKSLSSSAKSLTDLATAGLPPSAAAELNAAISAMSAVSASPINIPKIGLNTNDRTEQTLQISNLLGDSRIPVPNFTDGPSAASIAKLGDLTANNELVVGIATKVRELASKAKDLQKDFYAVQTSLPAGSAEIESAKQKWLAAVAAVEEQNKLLQTKT